MKERKIMEMLSDDISDIELPPISDKVLRALHDKAENKSEKSVHHTASAIKHKHSLLKIVFAAMLALFVLSVPIIIVITNKDTVVTSSETDRSIVSSKSVIDDESSVVNSYFNPEKKSSALEIIKARKTYGLVRSTNKSSKELESLLLTINKDALVYEDDSFIYNFDTEGNLIELLNKTPVDENGIAVSEQAIKDNAKSVLNVYFADWNNYSYDTEITNMNNAISAWRIVFSKKVQDLLQKKITMTFDKSGNIRRIVLSGTGNDVGIISKSEAIQIALNEIQSGKYLLPDFNTKDVDITVETKYKDNQPYYLVSIDDISIDKYVEIIIDIQINPKTGQIMQIDY